MPGMTNGQALIIGIADYRFVNPLPRAVLSDAADVCCVLTDPHACAYPGANVTRVLNHQASKQSIQQALAGLASRSNHDATVFVYFSGHGGRIGSGCSAGEYLLAVDTVADSPEALASSAISGADFAQALRAVPARRLLVVLDCCHSGGIGQPKGAGGAILKDGLSERYYAALASGRGRVILASCRDSERSYILPGARNSLFTEHLLDGLRGGAPGPGGLIRVFDLFHYLQPRVTAAHSRQHPIFKAEIEENFPVALHRGGRPMAPAAAGASSDRFDYDVFLSYWQHEPDQSWVCRRLLPGLEAAGLRVCGPHNFRLGTHRIKAIERAVEGSRYTLAVLSPGYLADGFTDLENTLAEHLGVEQSKRRLVAVLRSECEPRLGIRARLWLDMTRDDEFQEGLQRLVYELQRPPDACGSPE
jgi:caspase domain-containing protein/TIR domain-containing protein